MQEATVSSTNHKWRHTGITLTCCEAAGRGICQTNGWLVNSWERLRLPVPTDGTRVTVMVTYGSWQRGHLGWALLSKLLKAGSYLWLVMCHLLNQWLTGELLRAAGEVLGRVSGALCYNRWSCCRCWVHHGGCAWRVVLVWPLLGHVGYCRFMWRDYMGKKFCLTSLNSEVN